MQIKLWNNKIVDAFFSDQELNFRGYALYLLSLIFFSVTIIVAIYDALLGYWFDTLLEISIAFFSLLTFFLNIKYRYNVYLAQLFFWQIAFSAFIIVFYHQFDSTTLFFILTPIIAILILPPKHVIVDFILYETIVAALFYYGYQHYSKDNPIIFSQLALLNYITGTLYLFMFWFFYHVSIERAVSILSKLYTQKNILFQELHHRVKNNFNLILSLLKMQARHQTFNNTEQFIESFTQRIESIVLAHELLYINKHIGSIDLQEYIIKLSKQILIGRNNINISYQLESFMMPMSRVIYIGLMLNEMITNTIKHSQHQQCHIQISLQKKQKCYELLYKDNLPIKTIKKEGFGMKIIRLAAHQLHGNIEISSHKHLTYTFQFPCKEDI